MPRLIKCPVCNHDLSSDAMVCPGCGHPIMPRAVKWLLVFFTALIALGTLVAIGMIISSFFE